MPPRLLAVALLAVIACGQAGTLPRCRKNAECESGLVCLVPVASEQGVCASPPFGVGLVAPAPNAQVGGGGVEVTAVVSVASSDGAPPDTVAIVADGKEVGALALASRSGAILQYQGTYVPSPGISRAVVLAVAAKTAAGTVPSDAIVVVVDTKPPLVTPVRASCAGGCARDGALVVQVQVEEEHAGSVEASLEVGGHAPVPLVAVGPGDFEATLPLAEWRFPAFSGIAAVTVLARDSFGNESSASFPAVAVTRLRWAKDLRDPQVPTALKLTGPAIDALGDVTLGGSDGKLYVVHPAGDVRSSLSIGSAAFSAPPSASATTVWIGSDDGNLYGRKSDGTLLTCPASGQATGTLFTPAIRLTPTEAAYTGGSAMKLYGSTTGSNGCFPATPASTSDAVTTSPVIAGGKVFVATASGIGAGSVRTFALDLAAGSLVSPVDGAVACGRIDSPLAADASNVIAACSNGKIFRIDASTLAYELIASLSGAATESVVVLPGGDILVGTNDDKVHRLSKPQSGTGTWTEAWSPAPDLGSPVTGVLVAAADPADAGAPIVYAVTASGQLHALDANGTTVWSTSTEPSAPLGRFALSFPTIAPALPGQLPTLCVGSAEGKLYAVVVDTGLDASSPWPKSHHDVRNTGNAAAPLP